MRRILDLAQKGGGVGKSDRHGLHGEDGKAVGDSEHSKPVFDQELVVMVAPVCHSKAEEADEEMGW